MDRLKVKLSNMILDNPIIPASGTFGYGYEFNEYYDINILGSFSCKGTTVNKRYGNKLPRIAECDAGLINSVGLQNPGIDNVIEYEFKELSKTYNKKIIANISGYTIDEFIHLAKIMDKQDIVGIIEVNVSCPNIHDNGVTFGADPNKVYEITKAIKEVTTKPIYIKLSPNVTDIVSIAKKVEEANGDGISMINTLLGARFDLRTGKPIIANKMGGFSGNAIKPIALRMVYQVAQAVQIPIIGIGGISSAEDVIEFMSAGASAVQIGAANLINPYVCKEIIEDLPKVMDKYNIENLKDIIGRSFK